MKAVPMRGLKRMRARRSRISGTDGARAAMMVRRQLLRADSFCSVSRKERRGANRRQAWTERLPQTCNKAHMAVPSMPRPRFAMIEPEIGFGPLEAFFDGPAQACDAGEFGERRVGGDKAKIIGSLGWSAPVASDQDKALEAAVACPGQADTAPSRKVSVPWRLRQQRERPRLWDQARRPTSPDRFAQSRARPQTVVGSYSQNIGLSTFAE